MDQAWWPEGTLSQTENKSETVELDMHMNQGGHNCFRLSQVKDQNSILQTTDQENIHDIHRLSICYCTVIGASNGEQQDPFTIDLF